MTTQHSGRSAQPVDDSAGQTASSSPAPGRRTVAARVLSLLEAFAHGGGVLSLTELSRYTGLPLTTTHRLVGEMVAWGGLERTDGRRYRLTTKLFDLAAASTRALMLRETALPHLSELHRRTGLTVYLTVRDGTDVVYLETLRSHPNYTGRSRTGGRLPLHVTASGLVLLAFAGDSAIADYVTRPLKRYTPHTLVEPDALLAYLRRVRGNGYAVAERVMVMTAGSVGAPVHRPDGTVDTAVGIVYLPAEHESSRLIDEARVCAGAISRSLRGAEESART